VKKIQTLFVRDPEDMKRVLPEVTPGCEWVLAGEGVATRKYDGTCCMFDGLMWWVRREVKPGKQVPDDFRPEMIDEATGKTVGWVPMVQSAFARWHQEALDDFPAREWAQGTYELCGPKINGNPEQFIQHKLIEHADAEKLYAHTLDYEGLRETVLTLAEQWGVEGLVWHHLDGRMAKLKARDFPRTVALREQQPATEEDR
jgi:hypothetical protein